jgi:hypothetical protein
MEKTFTYRNGCIFFVAFWFSGLGLVFSLIAFRAMLDGHPMPVTTQGGSIVTGGPLSWLPVLLPAFAVPIGVWLFMFAANSKVVLDDKSIRIYNWAKRLIFSAAWGEITFVTRAYGVRGGYNLAIQTSDRQEIVTNSILRMRELEQDLADRTGRPIGTSTEIGFPLPPGS